MKGLVADVIIGLIAIEAVKIYGKIKYEQGRCDVIDQIYDKDGYVVFVEKEKES